MFNKRLSKTRHLRHRTSSPLLDQHWLHNVHMEKTNVVEKRLFASPLADTYILLQPPPGNRVSSLPQYWLHTAQKCHKNASLDLFASPLTGTYILCASTRSINSRPNPHPSANHNLAFQSRSKKLHFSTRRWQLLLSALLNLLLFRAHCPFFVCTLHPYCHHSVFTYTVKMPVLHLSIVTQDIGADKLRGEPHSGTQSREFCWNHPGSHYRHA